MNGPSLNDLAQRLDRLERENPALKTVRNRGSSWDRGAGADRAGPRDSRADVVEGPSGLSYGMRAGEPGHHLACCRAIRLL